ncbi:DUF2252 domain-containing protein [Lysobacter enzymogenes]|uniref:DUF2252 domain-containing protein n=1 Tax=Lysobacter enzymogenes TaxID=69 RepID=A0A3N2RKE6_LYSEN|nr:DUF2252 family protein [Lysobacter enzymogenes]ROU07952.1 DUF2252 domain-containing protein [Lysobacter enzymogenes]
MKRSATAALAAAALAACVCAHAQAAAPRDRWVVQQLYGYNHPYAASAADELAVKMEKMAQSPYVFYRGTAHLFFQDMRTVPVSRYANRETGYTWISGDMHLGNFDASRDAGGVAVFKLADHDEAYLGQYIWDLRRLTASMVLVARANGLGDAAATAAIDATVDAYAAQMAEFKRGDAESGFKLTQQNTSGTVQKTIEKADKKSPAHVLDKFTAIGADGRRAFLTQADLVEVPKRTRQSFMPAMNAYVNSIGRGERQDRRYYALKDVRQKLGSGVGSLGKLRYYVLIEGRTRSNDDDLVLEWKQEGDSAVAIAAPGRLPAWSYLGHEGNRVVKSAQAQRIAPDPLIGYSTLQGRPYYVHEKTPFQEDLDPSALNSADKLGTAAVYAAQALASAHALGDRGWSHAGKGYDIDRRISDAIVSVDGLKAELREFSFDYAAQVEFDWTSFVTAYEAGVPLY